MHQSKLLGSSRVLCHFFLSSVQMRVSHLTGHWGHTWLHSHAPVSRQLMAHAASGFVAASWHFHCTLVCFVCVLPPHHERERCWHGNRDTIGGVSAVIKVTCCDFGMENRWEFNSCQVNGTCCITLSCVSHDVPPLSCKSTSCCAIYKPLTPPAHSNLLYFVYIPFLIWGLICGSYLMWEGYLIKCKFFSFYDILWVYFVDLWL